MNLPQDLSDAIEAHSKEIKDKCINAKLMDRDNQLLVVGQLHLNPPFGVFYPQIPPSHLDIGKYNAGYIITDDHRKILPREFQWCDASWTHWHFKVDAQ